MSSVIELPLEKRDSDYLDERLQTEKEFWLQKLSRDLPVAGLPLDHPRSADWSDQKETVRFTLAPETFKQLRKVCRDKDALTFTALVAALKICLHLYTGIEDVTIGTAIHEHYAEVASLNKVLALRDHVDGNLTVRRFIAEVKRTLSEAYVHQKYPFEKILQLLDIDAPVNRSPLFSVVALFDRINRLSNVAHLKNDLTLQFLVDDERLSAVMMYRPDLFERANIEIFSRHYQQVLRAALYHPDMKIGQIELLSSEKRGAVIDEFNRTQRDYPHVAIHQLFEKQVRRTPSTIAVVHGKQQLTYRELNDGANQLARYLQRHEVGPGERVAICLTHSTEMLVAILGILKAGGTYIPLDPGHPTNDLAVMLADARPRLLLSETRLAGKLAQLEKRPTFLDGEAAVIAREETDDLRCDVTGDDLAYVIYTSGSTGEPKGVMIQHASLVNYICWANEVYLRKRPFNFALYSSLAFDLTVTSIFAPLTSGSCINIYQQKERLTALPEILEDDQVEVLKLTPSHLSLIKDRDNSGSRVQVLIVGGEALETALARRIHESFGEHVEIFNEYGPTEATVGCMLYKYDPQKDGREFVPIGSPAANTQIYVLDQNMRPVAENIIGELCISGDGLALGYLNKDDLTRAKFVDHPFIDGRRLYRSGDRARWLADGRLEYLGRNDEQVKFHGHRVELNHIRSTLNRHRQVRDSVVVVVKDRHGNDVMLAYYVSRQALEASELRRFLSEHIVAETVPNFFVHLRRLPLTLNGKVNQQALPTLEQVRESLRREFVAPRTETERQLAKAWMRILGVERVGIYENFFELGGHSLLATQLISRIRDALHVEVPLRNLFEAPTIAGLAEIVEKKSSAEPATQVPALVPVARDRELPLSFAQQRLWFLNELQPGNHYYHVPAALRLSGRLNLRVLEQTFTELMRRHDVLRTNFPKVNGSPVQRIVAASDFQIPLIDLRSYNEEERQARLLRIIDEEARRPFDLEKGLMIRVILLQLGEEEQVAFFMLHHIVSDAWSTGILINEVSTLYRAFLNGEPSPLPELPIQYVDYSVWQREWLRGDVLDSEIAYWKKELRGIPPMLQLPADHSRPPVQKFEGASESYQLSEQVVQRLKELSRRAGVTMFMTTLAAFKALLYRYTNQEDLLVGAPISGRNLIETENLIGFFTNTLALRTRVTPRESFVALLQQVRDVVFRAYEHQELPIEKLVEELNPERSLSHTPLLQVVFGYYNNEDETLELPGVKLSSISFKSKTAKFDLVHNVAENSGTLSGSILYNTDLFEPDTIRRMARHYTSLLTAIAENPRQTIAQLPFLPDDEKQLLLSEWNNTRKEHRRDLCAHQVFERRAELTPDAVAVASEAGEVSYAELSRRANRLAHFLRERGVGREIPVCILLERSIEMIVAELAVLKAGGTFVPLDPATPLRRLSFLLDDSQSPVLITEERLSETLPAYWGQVVLIDSESFDAYDVANPICNVTPANLAYVVYTSGSTGQPKGVQVQHDGLLNLVHWHIDAYNISGADRTTQLANPAFDASIWEIWPYLLAGASIHIPPDEIRLNVASLIEWLRDKAITISFLPTPLAEILIDQSWPSQTTLRFLLTGGDKLHHGLQRQQPFSLINHYGPTETTIVTTFAEVEYAAQAEMPPPIGTPIGNAEVYLLDTDLAPVPIGIAGELEIGGEGVARGYAGRPDLTAERFIPHPFSAQAGERLYRTGDLARRSADGQIHFVGRIDQQVKLRGFRIELGEIEAQLLQHPKVVQAAVVLRPDSLVEERLVAYLVFESECETSELKDFLRQRLPDYMIPTAFVDLPALPLTQNGKVDHSMLPAVSTTDGEEADSQRPLTPLEKLIADVWSEVLGRQGLEIKANFFEIGGDSIKAAIIVNRIQQQLDRIIHVVTIFDAPTIEQYAAYLQQHYSDAVGAWQESQLSAGDESSKDSRSHADKFARTSSSDLNELRCLIEQQPWRRTAKPLAQKNPPMLFILSAPRSGSTLLRVMLGGHSSLFAPPELELLGYDDLSQRREAHSGRQSFWQQGTVRALMQLRGCGREEAELEMAGYEDDGISTQEFYRLMQQAAGGSLIVDKTPSYTMDMDTLRRGEEEFEGALYLHLVRNPYGMIRSFEEAHVEQIFPRFAHPFCSRKLAEVIWTVSEQNILSFLKSVPEERQRQVEFERLVREPEQVMREVSSWLGLEYEEVMIEPYLEKQKRMTDGVNDVGKMLGDIKFLDHVGIEQHRADSWRSHYHEEFLGEETWEVAESLGYDRFYWGISSATDSAGRNATIAVDDDLVLSPILPAAGNGEIENMIAQIPHLSDDEVAKMLAGILEPVEVKQE
jgi:amino acid adenylation domain-containing protein